MELINVIYQYAIDVATSEIYANEYVPYARQHWRLYPYKVQSFIISHENWHFSAFGALNFVFLVSMALFLQSTVILLLM